jgi:hypothetical protein
MKRLVEELPACFETRLLASEKTAEPSSEVQARALETALDVMVAAAATAAGAAVATSGNAGGAALTTKLIPGLAWKTWVVGVVLSSAVGTGTVLVVKSTRHETVAPSEPKVEAQAPSAAAVPHNSLVESAPVVLPSPEPKPTAMRSEHIDRNVSPPALAHSAPPRPSAESDLAGEIRMIDNARAALAGHDPNEAIAILAEFEGQYPSASLLREAALLRIEALAERGDRGEAVRRAKELMAQSPEGPYQARLRKILERETSP